MTEAITNAKYAKDSETYQVRALQLWNVVKEWWYVEGKGGFEFKSDEEGTTIRLIKPKLEDYLNGEEAG